MRNRNLIEIKYRDCCKKRKRLVLDTTTKIEIEDDNTRIHRLQIGKILDIVPYVHWSEDDDFTKGRRKPEISDKCVICGSLHPHLQHYLYKGEVIDSHKSSLKNDQQHEPMEQYIYLCDNCTSLIDKIAEMYHQGFDLGALVYALIPMVSVPAATTTVAKTIHLASGNPGRDSRYLWKYITSKSKSTIAHPMIKKIADRIRNYVAIE